MQGDYSGYLLVLGAGKHLSQSTGTGQNAAVATNGFEGICTSYSCDSVAPVLLLVLQEGMLPIHFAAMFNRLDVAAMLLDKGSLLQPTPAKKVGMPALHQVTRWGPAHAMQHTMQPPSTTGQPAYKGNSCNTPCTTKCSQRV